MKCKICDSKDTIRVPIKNPQNKKEKYEYSFCKNCGVGFLKNINSKDIRNNYNEEYKEYEDETKKNFYYKLLNLLYFPRKKYLEKNCINFESILDIGCGNGSFLNSVSDNFKKLFATEFNKFALSKAKNKIKNLIVLEEDLRLVNQKFDVITLWHVLEHIPNPYEFLKKLKSLMHKDSRLIIEVPNSDSLNFKFFKSNYQWVSLPEHLFYYNEKALRKLLSNLGFELLDTFYPRMFPLLFSSHITNPLLRKLSYPLSIFLFLISPIFKASESIRVTCKVK